MTSGKEALAIILDIGPNMFLNKHLMESLQLIKMILERKLFSESKDEITLILLGSAVTKNHLSTGNEYTHISIERSLAAVTFDFIEYIQNFDMDSKGHPADFVDAIIVAMDDLKRNTDGKKTFSSKRIILFSNLMEKYNADQLDDIIAALKESHFEFNYIGPCLQDDDSEGAEVKGQANGEVKNQKEGQEVVRRILDQVDGDYFSLKEVLTCLSFVQSRCIRPTPWKANLKIGASLDIPVCLYIRVKEMKSRSFKNVFSRRIEAEIERSRSYHLMDEKQTEIDKSDIIDGYRYGSTIVPFSSDDKEAMKMKTEKCFKVLGFTKSENVKRHQYFSDSVWVCVADKTNELGQLSLSALMRAMFETNMVAIVRRVHSNNGQVKIGCLMPHIKDKYECLFYVDLPFAEDLRPSTFCSLPLNDSCTNATNKAYKCTDEQLNAVDSLINAMDLSGPKNEDDDNSNELLKPKLTFNPYLQRLYQCIEHRALHASSPLPGLSPVISSCLQTPPNIKEDSKIILEKMKTLFPITPVENTHGGAKDATNVFAHVSSSIKKDIESHNNNNDNKGGDLKEVLKDKVTEVGITNPVEDFQEMIQQDKDSLHLACKQMEGRIEQLIADSFGTNLYCKAVQCLKALRSQCIKVECESSQVSDEQAEEFLAMTSGEDAVKGGQQDADNMLQELE